METPDYELHTHIGGQLQNLYQAYENAEEPLATWIRRGYVWSEVEKRSILFVGMNPSYTEDAKPESYSFDPQKAVEDYPRFFKPFRALAAACRMGKDWTYTDVFSFRETNQNQLWKVMATDDGLEFVVKQLRLTMRLLEYLKPELIVVCNSGARRFFGADRDGMDNIWMGYEFAFDSAFGVDVITGIHPKSVERGAKTTSLVGTPVLFASTLTYMDRSSKKRLAWQMSQILRLRNVYFKPDDEGHIADINERLRRLLKELTAAGEEKEQLIRRQHYQQASYQRDRENAIRKEVLEMLVKLVGNTQ